MRGKEEKIPKGRNHRNWSSTGLKRNMLIINITFESPMFWQKMSFMPLAKQ